MHYVATLCPEAVCQIFQEVRQIRRAETCVAVTAGLFLIGQDCNSGGLSRRMRPVLHFLFPDLPQEHPANEYIATNMYEAREHYGY